MGTCQLCQSKNNLKKGHYIPKSIFRAVAKSHQPYDQDPILISSYRNSAIFSSYQPTQKLLCTACEQRFSRFGESPVSRLIYGSRGFPLRDTLKGIVPSGTFRTKRFWNGYAISQEIDSDAFKYFILSILWRGSVGKWPKPYSSFRDALDVKYSEHFRNFLLGQCHFPSSVCISVYVDFEQPSKACMIPPNKGTQQSGQKVDYYYFLIPGMQFEVRVGGDTEILLKNSNLDSIIFREWHYSKSPWYRGTVKLVRETPRKRKLAKLSRDRRK